MGKEGEDNRRRIKERIEEERRREGEENMVTFLEEIRGIWANGNAISPSNLSQSAFFPYWFYKLSCLNTNSK